MLFAALIGPYLVDWTAYRETFEREASAYVGRPVTIAGKAEVRLLPTPVLSFTDIRIGEAAAPEVEVERFRAEVELAPLLKGEVRIIQMSVERPRLRFDVARLSDPTASDAPGAWRLDAERISLARLEISEGVASIVDSRAGRSWAAEQIDAVIEAGSLRGPGRIEGELIFDGVPVALRAGFGRFDAGEAVPVNVALESPLSPVTLSADGLLSVVSGQPPQYKGAVTVAGAPAGQDRGPGSPWTDFRATGAVELTPAALQVEEAQIFYGVGERPLVLEASGLLYLGSRPYFDFSINARQIDIDQALGGGPENPVAIEDGFAALLLALPELPRPPIPGAAHLDAQGVVIGGGVIQAVGIDVATAAEGFRIDALAALLPGDTRVDLNGNLRTTGAPVFQGRGRMASDNPAALAAWWRGQVGSAAKLGSFAIAAELDLGPDNQRLSGIAATIGAGSVTGSVELRRFSQPDQRFVNIDLSADRADLVEARALTELLLGDAVEAGYIDQMTLSLRADVLTAGGIEARSVVVDGALQDGRLDLGLFSVADLAGASVEVRGSIDAPFETPSGRVAASIKAEDVTGAAAFLASVLPENRIVSRLREIAPLLSPVEAEISANSTGAGAPLSVDLTGSFAATHLILTATGEGAFTEPESLNGSLKLHLDGEDSAKVLAQLGLDPLPVQSGPLRVDLDFQGAAAAGALNLDALVAGVAVNYQARSALRDGRVVFDGDVRADSADLDAALLLAGFAVPGLGEAHAASASGRAEIGADGRLAMTLQEASFDGAPVAGALEVKFGDVTSLSGSLDLQSISLPLLASLAVGAAPDRAAGAWSDAAFSAALPPDFSIDVAAKARTLDLGLPDSAGNAALRFGLAAGALTIDLGQADFAGGKLKGAIVGSVKDGEAELTMRGALQGAELRALVWERSGLPIASGLVDLSIDLAGRGRSMAGLVSTLAGTGSFAIGDGRINALNPEALVEVAKTGQGEEEPDEQLARETFAIHFGSGAFPFGRAAGSFSAAAGVVDVPSVSVSAGGATVLAAASFDLNTLTVTSEWVIRAAGGNMSEDPFVTVAFSGAIAEPERRVDLNPLLNLVRSNYLQRQLDEIEELEEARRQAEARRIRAERTPPVGPPAAVAPPVLPPGPALPADMPNGAPPPASDPPRVAPPLDLLPQQGVSTPFANPEALAPL